MTSKEKRMSIIKMYDLAMNNLLMINPLSKDYDSGAEQYLQRTAAVTNTGIDDMVTTLNMVTGKDHPDLAKTLHINKQLIEQCSEGAFFLARHQLLTCEQVCEAFIE